MGDPWHGAAPAPLLSMAGGDIPSILSHSLWPSQAAPLGSAEAEAEMGFPAAPSSEVSGVPLAHATPSAVPPAGARPERPHVGRRLPWP